MTSKAAVYREKDNDAGLSSDDEDEVSPLLLGQDSDDDEDKGNATGNKKKNGRHEPPRPSILNPRASILPTNTAARRNRRRSSARFMDIRGGGGGGRRSSIGSHKSSSSSSNTVISKKSLGDMYKNVIRMNAENRINASNSWNLKLIDNIDKFLLMDDNDDDDKSKPPTTKHGTKSSNTSSTATTTSLPSQGRVNFTKASCTLDASVKIYSYRVDDVHLTSYKVLANLHRTDNNTNGKNKKKGSSHDDDNDDMDHDNNDGSSGTGGKTKARSNKPTGPTLESNLGNLNLSRLDSAFDIDPLFHKMSKTFDEGGAKGLLLANLGVGREGCDIVFDSTENLDDEKQETTTTGGGAGNNGLVDISSLTAKLADSLGDMSLLDLSLVPQLAGLRAEYAELDEAGYVEADALASSSTSRSRRYAPEPEEEKEADRSIHQEAMERSRASFAHSLRHDDDDDDENVTGKTPLTQGDGDDDEYAADDYGGGYNDDDDDDDAFVNFLATDTNASRFSSGSFAGSGSQQQQFESQEPWQQTSVLLDALAAGQLGNGQSDYEYFDASQVQDNAWAGATHWKRTSTAAYSTKTPNKARRESSRTTTTKPTPKKAAKKKKAGAASNKTEDCVLVNLLQAPADLDDILRKPPAPRKGQRQRAAADPLQLTTVAKLTKMDNLLPLDVGIGIEVLSSLFLRPDAALFKHQLQQLQKVASSTVAVPVKSVGFNMDQVQTFGDGGGGDNNYDDGDDDDGGAGYDMGGGNDDDDDGEEGGDFFVQELDNVRKVEKVSVGYATVAKKVDVKRLKRDLWVEIESHFDKDDGSDVEEKEDHDDKAAAAAAAPHSFQQAVKEMEANKTQMDVTLPYYFICLLHLANEQNLYLESKGLDDFEIHLDNSENDL